MYVLLDYRCIYGKDDSTLKSDLSGLNYQDTVAFIANICFSHMRRDFISQPVQQIKHVLGDSFVDYFEKKVSISFATTGREGDELLNSAGLLEAIIFCNKNKELFVNSSNASLDEGICRWILLSLILEGNRISNTYRGKFPEDSRSKMEYLENNAVQIMSSRYSDFENPSTKTDMVSQYIKLAKLHRVLRNNPQIKQFCDSIGLSCDPLRHVRNHYSVLTTLLDIATGCPAHFSLPDDDDELLNWVNDHSWYINDNIDDIFYFKRKPIMKLGDNRFIVPHISLFVRILNDVYFHEIRNRLGGESTTQGRFFKKLYDEVVIEELMLKECLHEIFGKGWEVVRPKVKRRDNPSLCDVVAASQNKIVMFECKNITMSEELKSNLSPLLFDDFIMTRFVRTNEGGKIKHKGISQIYNTIVEIDNIKGFDRIKFKRRVDVYPVLIVNDPSLNIPNVNQRLFQFQKLLVQPNPARFFIHPVTIIQLDTLFFYMGVFQKNSTRFIDQLKLYSIVLKSKASMGRSFSQYFRNIAKNKQQFSQFIQASIAEKGMDSLKSKFAANALKEIFAEGMN